MILRGVAVCPGIAVGRVVFAGREIPTLNAAGTPEEERQKLDRAMMLARQQLVGVPAQRQWLDDRDLTEFCWELVASGTAAVTAWHRAFSRVADRLAGSPGELFARRAEDVREAGRHVLRLLATGSAADGGTPSDAIVIARSLAPADLSALDAASVRGICTVSGLSDDVAAFARSCPVPAAAEMDARVLDLAPGLRVVLDGARGHLIVGPQVTAGNSLLARLANHIAGPFLPATRRR